MKGSATICYIFSRMLTKLPFTARRIGNFQCLHSWETEGSFLLFTTVQVEGIKVSATKSEGDFGIFPGEVNSAVLKSGKKCSTGEGKSNAGQQLGLPGRRYSEKDSGRKVHPIPITESKCGS